MKKCNSVLLEIFLENWEAKSWSFFMHFPISCITSADSKNLKNRHFLRNNLLLSLNMIVILHNINFRCLFKDVYFFLNFCHVYLVKEIAETKAGKEKICPMQQWLLKLVPDKQHRLFDPLLPNFS